MKQRILLGLSFLCLLALTAQAQVQDDEPPSIGQPEDFSNLVGQFSLAVSATPTDVFVDDPITLKITITGSGPNRKFLPDRKSLKVIPKELEDQFYVGGLPDKDRFDAKARTWEFYYQLRPKHEGIKEIPLLVLTYYNPKLPADARYQPSIADAIALTVKPRPQVILAPERMYQLAAADAILWSTHHWVPDWLFVALGVIVPPVLSFAGYRAWRQAFPDARTRALRRQSRVARETLRSLRCLRSDPQLLRSSALVAEYLRARLDLRPAEPTPEEAAQCLAGAKMPPLLMERAAEFFRLAQEARFAPSAQPALDAQQRAMQLIAAVEEAMA